MTDIPYPIAITATDFEEEQEDEDMRHPPYHLRTNKAVDRLLLVDLIRALGRDHKELAYYTLAGPFLEDLRIMDQFFPDMRLVSLESNAQTFKRQDFHKFNSRIELKNATLSSFLGDGYEAGMTDVFWLDYTDLKYARLTEFERVLKAVPIGSVVRITVRAEAEIDLGRLEGRISPNEIEKIRSELDGEFRAEFGSILPEKLVDGKNNEIHISPFAKPSDFARMVQMIIRAAASEAMDYNGSDRNFLHVNSTRYDDNTQMLSVSGIVCSRENIDAMKEKLKEARFVDFDWSDPSEINIPALSVKERFHLERHLPMKALDDAGERLHSVLEYNIDNGVKASRRQLANYADFYREYPLFIRLSV